MSTSPNVDWISLDRYAPALQLTGEGWYHQLATRQEIRRELDNFVDTREALEAERAEGEDTSFMEEELKGLSYPCKALELLRRNPILDYSQATPTTEDNRNPLASFAWDARSRYLADRAIYKDGVRSLTVRGIYDAEKNLKPNYRVYSRGYFGTPYSGDRKLSLQESYPWTDWIEERANRYSEPNFANELVAVDLTLPDRVLKTGFAKWLKEIRNETTETSITSSRKTPATSDWVTFGILPYLDLALWQKEFDIQLTNQQIADLIFDPKQNSSDQRVIEVTKPKAEYLVSPEGLREIASLPS